LFDQSRVNPLGALLSSTITIFSDPVEGSIDIDVPAGDLGATALLFQNRSKLTRKFRKISGETAFLLVKSVVSKSLSFCIELLWLRQVLE